MASTPVTPAPPGQPPAVAPKVSWLKKFGEDVLKALTWVAGKAAPVAQIAGAAVAAIDPVLAAPIGVAENLITKIANQAAVTEAAFAAVQQGSSGSQKLAAVLQEVGPEINAWVQANFPGAAELSTVAKTGLVNSIVAILNEIDPGLVSTNPTPAALAAGAAAQAAVAAAGGTHN
jgi:hypothetical protein